MEEQQILEKQIEHSEEIEEPIYQPPAGFFRRILAFGLDMVVAFLPAFVIMLIFSPRISLSTPLYYPAPIFGTLTLLELPKDVNSYMNNLVYSSDDITQEELKTNDSPQGHNVSFSATFARIISVFVILFYIAYSTFATVMYNGMTIGKYFLRLKVIDQNGAASEKPLLIREIIGKVILNSTVILPVISLFTILFTREHKAIHDMISKTRVVEW